ncbi:hypothetical protein BDZ45DRAFT_770113 [Acephala macrosclerotiorum]|nr:hypothetical protein BDZ45DRAFT_770113 [Acephala macrosclerotiorum]
MFLEIFGGPSRATQALMSCIALVVVAIGAFLCKMRTGVAVCPWSIAGTGSFLSVELTKLLQSTYPEVVQRNATISQISARFENKTFALQHYRGSRNRTRYGIIIKSSDRNRLNASQGTATVPGRFCISRRFAGQYGLRPVFFTMLLGLLGLILYDDLKRLNPLTDSFDRSTDSQRFGVRFLFTGLVVITRSSRMTWFLDYGELCETEISSPVPLYS